MPNVIYTINYKIILKIKKEGVKKKFFRNFMLT